jgi:hypothetical protein
LLHPALVNLHRLFSPNKLCSSYLIKIIILPIFQNVLICFIGYIAPFLIAGILLDTLKLTGH